MFNDAGILFDFYSILSVKTVFRRQDGSSAVYQRRPVGGRKLGPNCLRLVTLVALPRASGWVVQTILNGNRQPRKEMASSVRGYIFDSVQAFDEYLKISEHFGNNSDVVLYFHSVGAGERGGSISVDSFVEIIEHVSRTYEIAALDTVVGTTSRDKRVALTFDDARDDFYHNAFPILEKRCLPASLFVTVDWVGRDGYMSKGQIAKVIEGRTTIGNHTMTHPHLDEIDRESDRRTEIIEAKQELEALFDIDIQQFSYPYGDYDTQAVKTVRRSHDLAVTTYPRVVRKAYVPDHKPNFTVPRIPTDAGVQRVQWQCKDLSSEIRHIAERIGIVNR